MTTLERVSAAIARISGSDEVLRNPDVHLFETGLLDSFGTVELMLALEQEFGTGFSPADFDPEQWATPARIALVVDDKLR